MFKKRFTTAETALLFFVFILSIFFAAITNHAWEDWYITYRASKNLANGNGLVFQIGERLHTFTSPIGVLLPALLNFITNNYSDDLVLWLFRIISGFFLGLTTVALYRIGQNTFRLNNLSTLLLIGIFIFEVKNIDFTINGMETAFLLFAFTLVLYTIIFSESALKLGFALALLQYVRPDGFIYSGALLLGILVFNPQTTFGSFRRVYVKKFFIAGIFSIIFYLPWLIFTTWYYSTPIPHTIIAKGLNRELLELLKMAILHPRSVPANRNIVLDSIFTPAYSNFGGWSSIIFIVSWMMTLIGVFAWILPINKILRTISFTSLIGFLYLSYISYYPCPWYVPITTLLILISFVAVTDKYLFEYYQNSFVPKLTFVLFLSYFLIIFLCTTYQLKLQQQIIEINNRTKIAKWLKTNGNSNDTIFLECLGYIGFFSEMKMYDYPGMSSKEVVEARRKLGPNDDNFANTIAILNPKWLVLRDSEINAVSQKSKILSLKYELVKVFDVSNQVNEIQFLPGRGYLIGDQKFSIFKLK